MLIDLVDRSVGLPRTKKWIDMMKPLYDVTDIHVLAGYRLAVSFEDGLRGTVDLSKRLEGPVFGPLADERLFSQATIEHGTVVWPNGAALAPDVMYDEIRKSSCWVVIPTQREDQRHG